MIEILSPEFFRYHNKERIKNSLYTRAIWPPDQTVDVKEHPYLGVGEAFHREIRIAPKGVDFVLGYWIYGDRVAFVSSVAESFGFILESEELIATLKAQFELIWNLSRPLSVNPEDTRSFVDELRRG